MPAITSRSAATAGRTSTPRALLRFTTTGGRTSRRVTTIIDPPLEAVTLNKGQRAAGWVVFDVPARHGRLELRDLDEHTVGVWKY